VLVDGVKHNLRHLRACGIVEKYKSRLPMKSRKLCANRINGES